MGSLCKRTLSLVLLMGLPLFVQSVVAVEVDSIGRLVNNLYAPTSLCLTDDGITVLEPFSGAITELTTAGNKKGMRAISGLTKGLAWVQDDIYLFCDSTKGQVIRVRMGDGVQSVLMDGLIAPVDLIVTGDTCRVLDAGRRSILIHDITGDHVETIELSVPEDEIDIWLSDMAWDQPRDLYYVWNQAASQVLVFSSEGTSLGKFCSFGSADGSVTRGGEIVCDLDGWVYIADRYQGQIAVFDADREFVTTINPVAFGGQSLKVPSGLATDKNGLLYVASTEGASIDIFKLTKTVPALPYPMARPLRPADGDTLSAQDLNLVAEIQAPAALGRSLSAEFRVFAMPDTNNVWVALDRVSLTESRVENDLMIGRASWRMTEPLAEGKTFGWQTRAVAEGYTGSWSALRQFTRTAVFRLDQNAPNPFNPSTTIAFVLTGVGKAHLGIYDLRGRQVWDSDLSHMTAGRQEIVWDGRNSRGEPSPSGLYIYRLQEGSRSETRKMLQLK